jgi:hypothetical protein
MKHVLAATCRTIVSLVLRVFWRGALYLGLMLNLYSSFALADEASSPTLTNREVALPDKTWTWTAYVSGNQATIGRIKCVVYTLHPTFPEPVQRVCQTKNPQYPFALTQTGWGTFNLVARVEFQDGTSANRTHYLDFSKPYLDFSKEDANWVDASNGVVPPAAVKAGGEASPGQQSLYVCRAVYKGGLHPGKVRSAFKACNITFGGKELPVADYQVLVGNNFAWVGGRDGYVPQQAYQAGIDSPPHDKPLYICRAPALSHGGSHPGKLRSDFTGCKIGYAGDEETVNSYEVLVTGKKVSLQDSFPGSEITAAR